MKPGNAAATCIPDGIPRVLMTVTGLLQKWLETMGTAPGTQEMESQWRLSGFGPIIQITLFIVGWKYTKLKTDCNVKFNYDENMYNCIQF